MEWLFDLLNGRRAQVIRRLLQAPATQEELRAWLQAESGRQVNAGTMTSLVRPLIQARVILRASPRGPLRVTHEEPVRQLLRAATDLTTVLAKETQLAAGRSARVSEALGEELRRGPASVAKPEETPRG